MICVKLQRHISQQRGLNYSPWMDWFNNSALIFSQDSIHRPAICLWGTGLSPCIVGGKPLGGVSSKLGYELSVYPGAYCTSVSQHSCLKVNWMPFSKVWHPYHWGYTNCLSGHIWNFKLWWSFGCFSTTKKQSILSALRFYRFYGFGWDYNRFLNCCQLIY